MPVTDNHIQQPALTSRMAWLMLIALTSFFALSQAYRTISGILSLPLMADFALTPRQMGAVAASFHFAFGGLQPVMGIGMDLFGIRRTVLAAFPFAIAGSAMFALADSPFWLVLAQILIGIGCAPAFLACTIFIVRRFPGGQFGAVQGIAMGIGGLGLLFTGTPVAWLVEQFGWRAALWTLCALSALAWLLVYLRVREPESPAAASDSATPQGGLQSCLDALKGYAELLRMPHTAGILVLVFVSYASFMTMRGLWLGPYLVERFEQPLIFAGNIALVLSVFSLFAPALIGWFSPGERSRNQWLIAVTLAMTVLYLTLAWTSSLGISVLVVFILAVLQGTTVWQYANVRSAYPSRLVGRAMALFTMSMFLGIAVMQSLTGAVAEWALQLGLDPYLFVYALVAAMLALGCASFVLLPRTAPAPAQNNG